LPLRFDELSKDTQALLNTLEGESLSIRNRLDLVLGLAKDERDLRSRLLYLLDGPLKSLASVIAELRQPVVIVEIEEAEHPCDGCIVTTDGLDPGEHCEGCVNEMRQMDWVPPRLRSSEKDEVHEPVVDPE
jgi:hypothetical protein